VGGQKTYNNNELSIISNFKIKNSFKSPLPTSGERVRVRGRNILMEKINLKYNLYFI
jgi:hypothetical protein